MVRLILLNILVFSSLILFSQDKVIVSPFITIDGEKVFTSDIPQLDIIEFIDNDERKRFYKLKRRVIKVYPYAIETKLKLDSLNNSLDAIGKKRKRKHNSS